MRIGAMALVACVAVAGCGGKDDSKTTAGTGTTPAKAAAVDQTSPKALAEAIFAIAKDGDLALLAGVADPVDADGDAKNVASVAKAPAERQADFRKHFSTGTVSGEVKITGDKAEVPILFGPDGKKPETFNMVKRGERWHLQSF